MKFDEINYLTPNKFLSYFGQNGKYCYRSKMTFLSGLSTLGIGLTPPTFHVLRNIDFEMKLLMILVRGLAITLAAISMHLAGIRSGPVEQSRRRALKACRTS